jgi:hypothetical protein
MALYHFTAKAVSMGKGQSAVHTAAYNARCQLHDDRENRDTKDYGYKGATEFSGIFAPKDAPDWTRDREQLWNRATAAERQANGQPARNVEFALPHELNAEQRRQLVTDFARETFARRGMVADVHIHKPHDKNDPRTFHAHVLLTMRRLDGDNFAKTKEREWNGKPELEHWREKWAQMGARALQKAGHAQEADRFRHGHKTLAGQREAALDRGDSVWAQQCDKEAGIHKGPAVSAMERDKDKAPLLADNNIARAAREIEERNAARAEIRATEKELNAARVDAAKEREAAPPTGDLSQSQADIRLAASLCKSGAEFAERLEDKGYVIARVTPEEARDSERVHAFAKEVGNYAAKYREGEILVVNERGAAYRLDGRTTGFEDRETLDKYMSTIDPAAFFSLTDARAVQKEARQATFIHEQVSNKPPTSMEKKIDRLDMLAHHGETPLATALYNAGITLARVDAAGKLDVEREYETKFYEARIAGNHDAKQRHVSFTEGELVAVTKWGEVHRLNPKHIDHSRLEEKVCGTYAAPSLSATREFFATDRAAEQAERKQANADYVADRLNKKADHHAARDTFNEAKQTQRNHDRTENAFKAAPAQAASKATDAGFKVVNGFGKVASLLDSILGMKAKPEPATPQQQQAQEARAIEALEDIAADIEAGRDLNEADVKNLLPYHHEQLLRDGDDAMRRMIADIKEWRQEQEQEQERGYGGRTRDR